MKTIVLGNKTRLKAETLMAMNDDLDIVFAPTEEINTLISIYTPNGANYVESSLREFTILDEQDVVQGVHSGYTQFKSITSDGTRCTVKLARENELLTRIEQQDQTIADLLFLVAQGGM